MDCPFCASANDAIVCGKGCYARYDKYPVSRGHLLIIPDRHVASYFECTDEEKDNLWQLVHHLRDLIEEKYHPNGFNIGINVGMAAGQTIPHAHIHVIPRYYGDMQNPAGGVRGVIPEKQKYAL